MSYSILICPNCHGYKIVSKPPWIAGDVLTWADSNAGPYPCPTCLGQGFIKILNDTIEDYKNKCCCMGRISISPSTQGG